MSFDRRKLVGLIIVTIPMFAIHFINPMLPIIVAFSNSIYSAIKGSTRVFSTARMDAVSRQQLMRKHLWADIVVDGTMWLVAIITYLFL